MREFPLSRGLTLLFSMLVAAVCLLPVLSGSGTKILGQDTNATTYPHVVASVHRTNLTTTIPTTTLFTPSRNGLYRVSTYMVTTTSVPSSTNAWQFYLNWADDAGQEQWAGPDVFGNQTPPQAYNNVQTESSLPFRANAGTPVTYSTTVNGIGIDGSTYELFFTVEQLQ